jgi:hypothetical protein
MGRAMSRMRRRIGLKDGGVVDGKSYGKLHIRRPRQAGVDSTPISCDLIPVAGGWEDCSTHVQV